MKHIHHAFLSQRSASQLHMLWIQVLVRFARIRVVKLHGTALLNAMAHLKNIHLMLNLASHPLPLHVRWRDLKGEGASAVERRDKHAYRIGGCCAYLLRRLEEPVLLGREHLGDHRGHLLFQNASRLRWWYYLVYFCFTRETILANMFSLWGENPPLSPSGSKEELSGRFAHAEHAVGVPLS